MGIMETQYNPLIYKTNVVSESSGLAPCNVQIIWTRLENWFWVFIMNWATKQQGYLFYLFNTVLNNHNNFETFFFNSLVPFLRNSRDCWSINCCVSLSTETTFKLTAQKWGKLSSGFSKMEISSERSKTWATPWTAGDTDMNTYPSTYWRERDTKK